jgi:sugar lactone lactonase YvrE
MLDIIEQSSTGRILKYDPELKTTRIVAKGFSFANGVALSHDENSLFVSETGKYCVENFCQCKGFEYFCPRRPGQGAL